MDPTLHVLIPMLLLMALGYEHKRVLALVPLAVLPDLDVAFGLWAHRIVFHNFIFIIIIPLLAFLYIRKRYPDKLYNVIIGWFYLGSHLILDLEEGFAFFWPFSFKAPYFYFEILTDTTYTLPRIFFNLDFGIAPSPPDYIGIGNILVPEAFLILLLTSISLILNRKKVKAFLVEFENFYLEALYSLLP